MNRLFCFTRCFVTAVLSISVLSISIFFVPSLSAPADEYQVFDEYGLYQKLTYNEKKRYDALQYLFNDYQKKQYLSFDDMVPRAEWLRKYWLMLDPTPTTRRNERKVEHLTRVALVKKLFSKTDPPGWDDRGEVVIRFGMPDSRERLWATIIRFEQKMPGELWRYHSPEMLVTFTDHYLNGEYHWNYTPKGEESWTEFYRECGFGKTSRMTLEDNSAIYSKNSSLVTSTLPRHIDPHETNVLNMFNPDMLDYIARQVLRDILFPSLTQQIDDEFRKADRALTGFHTNMTRERFLHYPELDLSMLAFFDISAFDAGNGKVRTEINFEVPINEVTLVPDGERIRAEVELRILARDIDMNEVTSRSERITLIAAGGKDSKVPSLLPGQIVLTLDPGYYRFGIETVDVESGKRGSFNSSRRIGPFDERLILSDILFAKQIIPADRPSRYTKGNLTVIPHPLHLYRKPFPLTFYFEIYGLDTDKEDFAFYSIDYSIEPTKKKRSGPILEEIVTVISSSFHTSGFGSTQPQRLEIDTSDLWKGQFRLLIKVKDRRSREVATRTSLFSILE